jgi:hypothetical protein
VLAQLGGLESFAAHGLHTIPEDRFSMSNSIGMLDPNPRNVKVERACANGA